MFIQSSFKCFFLYAGEKQYKFEEFLPIYKELINNKDTGTHADFMEAFKTFDREGQGFISSAELRHVLCSYGKFSMSTCVFQGFE